MHAGVSVGPDGATHQMLEDMGLMRMLPHLLVLNPGDAEEARKAVVAAAKYKGPVYIRFGRANTPVFTTSETPFQIGKALTLWESDKPKIALLSTGQLSYEALLAARGDDEAMRIDEDFLAAMEHAMPPSGGMGMGIDRLLIAMTGQGIRETILFPLTKPL